MGVATGEHGHVHGEPGVESDRFEGVPHQRPGEVAADEVQLETGRLAAVDQVGPAADIDHGLGEGLVERHERVAVARDAGLVAESRTDRLAQHDRHVLHRVVRVDVGVA